MVPETEGVPFLGLPPSRSNNTDRGDYLIKVKKTI